MIKITAYTSLTVCKALSVSYFISDINSALTKVYYRYVVTQRNTTAEEYLHHAGQ